MKRTIFLHIGLEKTGSTTLQAVGNVNRDLLKSKGILYPKSPGALNHVGLAIYASAGSTLKDVRQIAGLGPDPAFRDFQARFPDELAREIEESSCTRIWLSNEHLSSRVRKPEELRRLASLLKPLAHEVRVLVYLRNQPDLLVSHYSTKVRSGSTRDLTLPRSENDYFFNFALLLQRWSAIWGKKALQVRIFDRACLEGGDITIDFFHAIGEPFDTTLQRPASLNSSLDAHALQFLRLFNGHIPRLTDHGLNPEYGQIASVLAASSCGPKFSPPASVMRQVADMFRQSNVVVAERYFGASGRALFAARDYLDDGGSEKLTVSGAHMLGLAALELLDKQVYSLETRLERIGHHSLPAKSYDDRDVVTKTETLESAVATTAMLWRGRQQRLHQIRNLIHGNAKITA